MKKTIITLLALAGVAMAESLTLTPVATVTDYTVASSGAISLSDTTSVWSAFSGKLDATKGFTLQITLSDWSPYSGSLFYFSTEATPTYTTSLVTVGYTSANGISGWKGAMLYNLNGSSSVTYNSDITASELPSHSSLTDSKLPDVTLFVTANGGAITLYEVNTASELVQICSTTALTTGEAQSIAFAQWSDASKNRNTATIGITAYKGALTETQMTSLIVPEPTTATLSLLALAGLAARRRRK